MTAVEELIKEFEQLKLTKLYEKSFKSIDDCIYLAMNKLELEQKQIYEAYQAGGHDSMSNYTHH
jgi:hypothetical protein